MTVDERIAKLESYYPVGRIAGTSFHRCLNSRGVSWVFSLGLFNQPIWMTIYGDTIEECLDNAEREIEGFSWSDQKSIK